MCRIVLFSVLIALVYATGSIYAFDFRTWMNIGRKFCKHDSDRQNYEKLLKCDQKISDARRKVLSECMWEVRAKRLDDETPAICQYYNLETVNYHIDECMFRMQNNFFKEAVDAYETANKTSKTIMKLINEIENEYEYCILLMEANLGFEPLCEKRLTEEQGIAIKKCEKIIPKMVRVIKKCLEENNKTRTLRPVICDNFEYSSVGSCSETTYKTFDQEKLKKMLNEKFPKYIACLKDINSAKTVN